MSESQTCVVVRRERPFDDSDELLLIEARARFDFEQKSAVALQSKATFFLALTAAFAGYIGTTLWKLLEKAHLTALEQGSLFLLLISFVLLGTCTVLLTRSALSRSYQAIASPASWQAHLDQLRLVHEIASDNETLNDRFRFDLLDAWSEAADTGRIINEAKAVLLVRAASILSISIPVVLLATLLFAVPILFY